MPTLNINGQQVTVGPEFSNLSHDDQNSTVDEIAQSMAAPDTGMDVLQSAGTGLEKGLASVAGLPGDVRQMGASLFERATGSTLPTIPGWLKAVVPGLHSSSDYMAPLQSAGLVHEPQTMPGQIAERIGEFAPAALQPETALGKGAATILPAVAGPAAGALDKWFGSPVDPNTADMAATLLTPFAGMKGVNSILSFLQNRDVMGTAGLRAAEHATYALADATGTEVSKPFLGVLIDRIGAHLNQQAYDLQSVNSSAYNVIKLMGDALNSPVPITLQRLQNWRQMAGRGIGTAADEGNNLNEHIYGELSGFMQNPVEGQYIGPHAAAAGAMMQAGDALHMRYKNSQLMDQFAQQAQNRAANSSASGETLGLRQKFRGLADQLADPNNKMNKFVTPDQRAAVQAVVDGNGVTNALRLVGSFNPGGLKGTVAFSGPGGMGGILGHGIAGAAWAGIPAAITTASKLGEHLMTKAAANHAAAMFRTGKPLPPINTPYPFLLPLLARGSFPGLLGLNQPDQSQLPARPLLLGGTQ